MTATEIIDKYEIPYEHADAVFEAYSAGMQVGFEATSRAMAAMTQNITSIFEAKDKNDVEA